VGLLRLRTDKTDYDISVGEGLAPPENERKNFVWIGAESFIYKVSRLQYLIVHYGRSKPLPYQR